MSDRYTINCGPIVPLFLTILFVCLKLTGLISWPWIWVICPLWIGAALGLAIFLGVLCFAGILGLVSFFTD